MAILSSIFFFSIFFISIHASSSVLLIYSGGTIGMKKVDGHYVPVPGYLTELMTKYPQFSNASLPTYDVLEYDPLLDSSNMNTSHWVQIAKDIQKHHNYYSGFVVIHGTDTLAYSASALSFLLENLKKPVVVTGAQVPLCEPYSDGALNLIGSIVAAATSKIPEVLVFFDNTLLRGNRVQKEDAFSFAAFESGSFNHLGLWGGELKIGKDDVLPVSRSPLKVQNSMSDDVAVVMFYPGISATFLRSLLTDNIKGLVILAFGMGNGPDENKELLQVLDDANRRGIVLVDASQCFKGIVDLTHYATGNSMAEVGCISALDMTPEAAFTKLSWLLAQGISVDRVKEKMGQNLRGELTGSYYFPPKMTSLQVVILTAVVTTIILISLNSIISALKVPETIKSKVKNYAKLNE
ncbi:hypothetical protein RCL1_001450 [Eukaryota sp. TZLM3-RCL]